MTDRPRHAREIPDVLVLRVVDELTRPGAAHWYWHIDHYEVSEWCQPVFTSRWNICHRLSGPMDELPQKLVNAKLRKLVLRGLLTGCGDCGDCRGDFELTDEGRRVLKERWESLL